MGEGIQHTEIKFVDSPLKEDWICPVCLALFKDPFLTECCGRNFCSRCITSVRQQQNVCPICRTYPIKGIIDKRLQRELNEVRVYCPLQPRGCEWTGELGQLKMHLNEGKLTGQCKHVDVDCPNNCRMTFPRRDIKRHANNECKLRSYTCPHCGHKDVYANVVQHHFPKCHNYPVTCPKCTQTKIKRNHLQKHFSVCPSVVVSCPFSEVGCKAKVKRCDLKKHSDSNFTQHQSLISTAIADLQKDNKTVKKDCQFNSQQTSTQLESACARISVLERKCTKLDYEFFSNTTEVKRQNKQLTEELEQAQHCVQVLFSNYAEVQEAYSLVCEENEQLRHSVDSLHSTCDALQTEVEELKSQLSTANELSAVKNAEMKEALIALKAETKDMLKREVTNKMACLQDEVSTLSQKHLQVDYWIDGYKLMAEKMKQVNWELYLRTLAETATQFPDPICPVIVHVNGYKEAKRQRHTLVTSSFYIKTARGDYKFVLVINFTSDSMVVSASLTRGKYDNILEWPFTGTIFVTLLNVMEDKSHYGKEIWSAVDNPGFKYAGKPSEHVRNPSWSRQDFISFKELECSTTPRNFIGNDVLYFEVNNSTRRDSVSSSCCVS